MSKAFATAMQERQLAWARDDHIEASALEQTSGGTWVLKRECRDLNLFRPDWLGYITRKEHRWFRSLISSQALAVNLFAPLEKDRALCVSVLQQLLPDRTFEPSDSTIVCFEHTPEAAPCWLGEEHTHQPTQIDMHVEVRRSGVCLGHLLIEVKYTEHGFGCCRGWAKGEANRTDCENITELVKSPQKSCWLAREQGRHYWAIMSDPTSSIRLDAVQQTDACPFRDGRYQMMRNRVLADELQRRSNAAWSDFAVCLHPGNAEVLKLPKRPEGIVESFRSLSFPTAVRQWNPREIVEVVRRSSVSLADWADWMEERYF
jgi:hypothetical protein